MKEIGLILRKRREEKKLTLETVNRRTHIPLKFLIALEEGNLSPFPAEVYFTGSLRKYASFLGLDPDQLVAQYRSLAKGPERNVAAPAQEKEKRPERGNRAILAAAAGSAIIILIVLGAVLAFILSRARQTAGPESSPEAVTPPAISTATVPGTSTSTVTAPKASTSTVPSPKRSQPKAVTPPSVSTTTAQATQNRPHVLTLQVRTTQESWTKVTADDGVVFQGTLGPGETRTWVAHDRFHLVVGYAPAVSVTLNGKPVDVRSPAVQDVAEIDLGWKDVAGNAQAQP